MVTRLAVMLPDYEKFRRSLERIVDDKTEQGHVTDGLRQRLRDIPDDYEALNAFGLDLTHLPMRADWKFEEPSDLAGIQALADWPTDSALVDPDDADQRVQAGFLGRVSGCVLGKPIEIMKTMSELRAGFEAIGEWPIDDYISERLQGVAGFERLHGHWDVSVRERLTKVPADDDLCYTIIGMLVLEESGPAFTQRDLLEIWADTLPIRWAHGPERTTLAKLERALTGPFLDDIDTGTLADSFNPGEELCGAMIRADAYGYASPGMPARAAELAWRDAHLTHRRTGIYGSMFAAAAIAAAFVESDPLALVETALRVVPPTSRFHRIVSDSLNEVAAARSWEDAYSRIHGKYSEYIHCQVFQETGTLINTLRFAESTGHGICLQVMQGNDTDSYGATVGSVLGIRFGADGLDPRWLRPFNNRITTQVAGFDEYDLEALARRMGNLVRIGARS
jgi:ADP-ribosylglycohydrolase